MLTKLEVFAKIKEHLLHQKAKSVHEDGFCAYRGNEGRMCAVGCLIEEKYYHENLEDRRVFESVVIKALEGSGVPTDTETLEMLGECQGLHDTMEVSMWEHALENLRSKYEAAFERESSAIEAC